MTTPPRSLTPKPRPDAMTRAAGIVAQARRLVVLTGAGVSAESGVPTFRDALTGHWANHNPEDLATPQAFRKDPESVTRWYDERRLRLAECKPNRGHDAIAELQHRLTHAHRDFTLITQNVDGLHQLAGSINPIEIHGSIHRWKCTRTNTIMHNPPLPLTHFPMPTPAGGFLRPDVVWFGEMLPQEELVAADNAVRACDVFLAVGTSGLVYPAAAFLEQAAQHGAVTIEINTNPTPLTRHADVVLEGKSGDILPQLIEIATSLGLPLPPQSQDDAY